MRRPQGVGAEPARFPTRAYLGGCMSPCGPRGVAWRGCGQRGGAGALLVGPRARREGLGRRGSPPPRPVQQRPGARRLLPGCMPASAWRSRPGSEQLLRPQPSGSSGAARARETTAESGGSGHPLCRPAPTRHRRARRCEVRLRAERRGRAGRPGRGRGASAGGGEGGGAGSDGPAPRRPHPPASGLSAHGEKSRLRATQGFGGVGHCGDPQGAPQLSHSPSGMP